MAPPSTRRAPPDPPDTGHRIIKQKNLTTKTNNSNKSSRTIFSSLESARKAEANRNALGAPQNTEKETPSGNDIQMNDPFESPSPSADAPDIHTTQTSNLQLETPIVSNTRNNVRIASLDLDYPGSDGDSSDDDLIYEDPHYDNFPSASGKIKEALLSVSEAASPRILEARELFDTISGIIDVHCQTSDPDMPPTHVRALKDLHEELTAVARRHFEAFVKETKALSSVMPRYPKGNPKPNTDERLFLRLPKDDPLRALSGYALQSHLK
ncbi:hypothetical protein EPUL_005828, partial [Erysiphe pulchra]